MSEILLGLIGHPVSHSMSPPMHEAAFLHCGVKGSYNLIDIAPDDLKEGVEELKTAGYAGFNITIPHKDAIYRMADSHTPESAMAQASNAVKFEANGLMLAHNTDIEGFRGALSERLFEGFDVLENVDTLDLGDGVIEKVERTDGPRRIRTTVQIRGTSHSSIDNFSIDERIENATACVIGTGGAAKAALIALANLKFSEIFVVSRDRAKAQHLCDTMESLFERNAGITISDTRAYPLLHGIDTYSIGERYTAVINSTPMGQGQVPVPDWVETWLPRVIKDTFVFDMVYSRVDDTTPLVSLAKQHGLRSCDGSEMLVRQAHEAFYFWTGRVPPVEVMRTALKEAKALNAENLKTKS